MIIANKELSHIDFGRLSEFIFGNFGIKMPINKKTMLQARLQSRLRERNMAGFKEYIDFVFSGEEGKEEIVKMIDVVSTNKTDFFREPKHFGFLTQSILPQFESRDLKIWSSASSSGEEPYTISMVIEEFNQDNPPINYSVCGTDISTRILEKATNAIYTEDRVSTIPLNLKRKYFLKSKNRENPTVRVIPELRKKNTFKRLNLMDPFYEHVPHDFDIIFCRNVLIYFDRKTQEMVINKQCRHLKPGGYFFLGHSESITGIEVPLKQVAPTIFKKIN
jgi:chemotaxis protein methyltransferase CheR